MGQATAVFMLNQYKKAASLYKQSVLLAENDSQRFNALYNAATSSFLAFDYISSTRLFFDSNKYSSSNNSQKFYKLSLYLEKLVLAEIARNKNPKKKKKSSEGKKTISSVDFVFDDDINLRIEENESSDNEDIAYKNTLKANQILLNNLIAAGVESIKIAGDINLSEQPSHIDKSIIYQFSNTDNSSYTPDSAMPHLWKRIFELEQGFPATLETPETLPGMPKW